MSLTVGAAITFHTLFLTKIDISIGIAFAACSQKDFLRKRPIKHRKFPFAE